jgi:hypothetical protein
MQKGAELRLEARRLYEHVIEGYQKQLGPHNESTLAATLNLAALLHDFPGEAATAECLYRKAIAGFTVCNGDGDQQRLTSMVSLAVLLAQEGQDIEAAQTFRAAADMLAEEPAVLPAWIRAHFEESYPDAFPALLTQWSAPSNEGRTTGVAK